MKSNPEIEAALERSLRKQVHVRRLDASFDAAVWARIAAEDSKSAAPLPARPAAALNGGRWLFVVNAVGIGCVAVVLCVFLFQWLAGIQLEATIPDSSFLVSEQNAPVWSMGIAGAALLFGFLYTPWGRQLRNELF